MKTNKLILQKLLALSIALPGFTFTTFGQQADQDTVADSLKRLSLEQLLNVEVTSVSRHEENLSQVASAIQVITRRDILRSAATSIPEALRLASNLQVAQVNSSAWIVSARGFNASFSNKLLVMIDGRTVYSPLFAGVFWDVQNLILEDIDRIEVISGPGGALWGANAVNGIVNIITRNASKTQGLFASVTAGTFLRDKESFRYGGKVGTKTSYRVYAEHQHRANTYADTGESFTDEWQLTQSGFRIDTDLERNQLMMTGNVYSGVQYADGEDSKVDGQNIMLTWSHTFSSTTNLIVQGYYARTWRNDVPSTFSDQLNTFDLDAQHQFLWGRHQQIIWGAGYRRMNNLILHETEFAGFIPPKREMDLFSAFVQDEIDLVPSLLGLTLGVKLQHNYFSHFEVQPNARISFTPTSKHTLWGAVSRAVRAPSRIDVDLYIPLFDVPPGTPHVAGGPTFTSEKLMAYELGYRLNPCANASLSLAGFYNRYDDLYSVEVQPDGYTYQIENGTQGDSHGIEFRGQFQFAPTWRINVGYTYFTKSLKGRPGHDLAASNYDPGTLGLDAHDMIKMQSWLDLPANLQLDITLRYVARLNANIPDYFTGDVRLAWLTPHWEASLAGQNLWEDRHVEYVQQIPRGGYISLAYRLD